MPRKLTVHKPVPKGLPDWQERFLEAYRRTGLIRESIEASGRSNKTYYEAKRSDPEFAAAIQAAKDEAVDYLEDVARNRAVTGSDVLLIFLLKAARPEVYRENHQVVVSGNSDAPLQIAVTFAPAVIAATGAGVSLLDDGEVVDGESRLIAETTEANTDAS